MTANTSPKCWRGSEVKVHYSSPHRWVLVGLFLAAMLTIGLTVGLP